ncbi:MAG: phosphatase PAP2 family protein [Eubacterium sp.]|nr:phosphatase PAP2 family protein [Eubacterium sp.]
MDLTILLWIQEHLRNGVLDTFFKLFTHLGDFGVFWIVLTALLLLRPQTRYTGIVMALSLLASVLLTEAIIKPLVDRPRPFEIFPLELLVSAPQSSSFPSGHSSASFASATAFFLTQKKGCWRWLLLVTAALIALSRLYLFVHNPTDVLAGTLLGIAAGWLCSLMLGRTSLKDRWAAHV